ncbi:MAG: Rhodanese-like domain-containing protein [Linnemannia gamsii]|nr:MAG: Rhodanese-like domain-containing protein [Linnemannia gamsii]
MSTYTRPTFVDGDVVKELLEDKSKVPGKDYLIVDGGHIRGSVNIPSHDLPERLPTLIEEYKQVPQLIFHCALSQVRGPKAANRWAEALAARDETELATEAAAVEAAKKSPLTQQVNVLRGGFGEWQRKHKDDKNLVVDYQAEYWVDDEY